MDDESFERWFRRREEARRRKKGQLRLSALDSGPRRGSHVAPDAPRLISRWDGYSWEPVAVASDWAAASAVLHAADGGPEHPRRPESGGDPRAVRDGGRRGAGPAERNRARLRELIDEDHYRPGSPA